MNASDAAPIAQYAAKQIKNDRVGCILQAKLVAEMARAVVERDAALERLAQIDEKALDALVGTACGTCYCEVLRGIRELAHFDT